VTVLNLTLIVYLKKFLWNWAHISQLPSLFSFVKVPGLPCVLMYLLWHFLLTIIFSIKLHLLLFLLLLFLQLLFPHVLPNRVQWRFSNHFAPGVELDIVLVIEQFPIICAVEVVCWRRHILGRFNVVITTRHIKLFGTRCQTLCWPERISRRDRAASIRKTWYFVECVFNLDLLRLSAAVALLLIDWTRLGPFTTGFWSRRSFIAVLDN